MNHVREAFTPKRHAELAARTVTVVELHSRAQAAASLAMRGQRYDLEDRRDCAAEITAQVYAWAKDAGKIGSARIISRPSSVNGGAPVSYSKRSPQKSLDTAAVGGITETVPGDRASFTYLYGLARTVRRAIDRDRDRDLADATERAATGGFIAAALGELPDPAATVGTPDRAASAAREIVRALIGVPKAGDAPIFTLAYSAARASAGLQSPEIARELDLTPAAHRQHLTRAAKRLRSGGDWSAADFADALEMPEGGQAYVTASPATETDWNYRAATEAPVKVRADKRIIRKPRQPQWARELGAGTPGQRRTAARLAQAAAIRDGRADR
jgi:hypothetical protein